MAYLEHILKQSPWLAHKMAIEDDVQLRRLKSFKFIYHDTKFLEYDFQDGVYIVTGPRQIGKSTHLKMLINNKITEQTKGNFLYFNCDLLDTKQDIVALVEEYLSNFPSKNRRYVLLDEVSAVKDSFIAIKFLIDAGFDRHITYILTGSNTISIKKTGEYLPGRRGKGVDFYFHPISFQSFINLQYPNTNFALSPTSPEAQFLEVKQTLNLNQLLNDYLMTGGFPRVINEFYKRHTISEDIFMIYQSWITSEIAKSDKKEYIAKRILERSLMSLSSDISYNALSQDVGVGSHNTIYDYLEFFTSSHVLSVIFNFDIHQKRINYKKNKKIYFNDPFIYAVLEAWLSAKPYQDYDYLKQPLLKSKLIENLVYIKLSHAFDDVYFYRGKKEIDFLAGDYLMEVKYQNKIINEDYQAITHEQYKGILITKNKLMKKNDILFIPIEYFLLCDF